MCPPTGYPGYQSRKNLTAAKNDLIFAALVPKEPTGCHFIGLSISGQDLTLYKNTLQI